MKKYIFLIISFLTFISCRRTWSDNILLSSHEFNFSSNGDSAIITSKGTGWWFADVVLDSNHHFIQQSYNCNLTYADSVFQIVRRSCDTLFVQMSSNKRNSTRTLWIQLESGDFFTSITIVQNKK